MKKLVLSALFSAVASASLFAASFSDLSYSVGTKLGTTHTFGTPSLQLGIHNAFADARLGFGAYSADNGTNTSSVTNIGLQLAGKYPVAQELNLTGGLEYVLKTGNLEKVDIDSASDLSVFVGLQKVFSKNFLVEGQLNLYRTSSEKLKTANAKTNCTSHILNSANLIVSYVF